MMPIRCGRTHVRLVRWPLKKWPCPRQQVDLLGTDLGNSGQFFGTAQACHLGSGILFVIGPLAWTLPATGGAEFWGIDLKNEPQA